MTLDLFVGGTLGAWALRNAPRPFVRQVVCLDDDLIALAAELGHDVFASSIRAPLLRAGSAALCVHYPLALDPGLIAGYEGRIWKLHPGLLPWGRGSYPVFWALWEGTPAGATLHEVVADWCDTGPVVEAKRVAVLPSDTGGRLHERVQGAERELYQRWLPRLATGARPPATPQAPGGSCHTLEEFEFLRDEGRYEVPRGARERLARCLTFPGRSETPERSRR
ncbi:MAG TPA: formyltransferase family protein [Solirubrobacteraceae bacterium]|nr:formyltransferase family protein [Solirubrobacteraceae bacterium]